MALDLAHAPLKVQLVLLLDYTEWHDKGLSNLLTHATPSYLSPLVVPYTLTDIKADFPTKKLEVLFLTCLSNFGLSLKRPRVFLR